MEFGLQMIFASYGWEDIDDGRVLLGFGRGLSKREFEPFRDIRMEETRERFGGIPLDQAVDSMKLFAEKVMPEVRSWH